MDGFLTGWFQWGNETDVRWQNSDTLEATLLSRLAIRTLVKERNLSWLSPTDSHPWLMLTIISYIRQKAVIGQEEDQRIKRVFVAERMNAFLIEYRRYPFVAGH
jgi:hypothetical protein